MCDIHFGSSLRRVNQHTSNYGPGVEINPMLLGLRFHMETKKEMFKNPLVPNRMGQSFDIWYVASSSRPLLSLFIRYPLGQKWPRPGGHNIGAKKAKSKILLLNLKA